MCRTMRDGIITECARKEQRQGIKKSKHRTPLFCQLCSRLLFIATEAKETTLFRLQLGRLRGRRKCTTAGRLLVESHRLRPSLRPGLWTGLELSGRLSARVHPACMVGMGELDGTWGMLVGMRGAGLGELHGGLRVLVRIGLRGARVSGREVWACRWGRAALHAGLFFFPAIQLLQTLGFLIHIGISSAPILLRCPNLLVSSLFFLQGEFVLTSALLWAW